MAILQPWQMYSLSSIAYISEPHFTTEFVGNVTLWSDTGLKCGVYTCIRGVDSDELNGCSCQIRCNVVIRRLCFLCLQYICTQGHVYSSFKGTKVLALHLGFGSSGQMTSLRLPSNREIGGFE
ncbi:hypothetical protein Tco_0740704 [Tanacetum coccineum]